MEQKIAVAYARFSSEKQNHTSIEVQLEKIEEFFSVSIFNKIENDDIARINYYTDVFASCGDGNIIFSDEKDI